MQHMGIILGKLLKSLLLIVIIYFWNKIVPELLVNTLSNFHKKYNRKNLDKFPITLLVGNEQMIIGTFKVFYWIALVFLLIGLWVK